jgi:predicted metal-dependent TIM-barrel fold hydrolase
MRDQIRAVGQQSVILSSDLGQVSNMPPVEGFAHYLRRLEEAGIGRDELRDMIRDNPMRLIG